MEFGMITVAQLLRYIQKDESRDEGMDELCVKALRELNNKLDDDYLRFSRRFDYDAETGFLHHKSIPEKWVFDSDENYARFLNKHAGKRACNPRDHRYLKVNLDGKTYSAHRVVYLLENKKWPTGLIDHINHDGMDNRLENLRVVTPGENNQNQSSAKGYYRVGDRWRVRIRKDGVDTCFGYFDTEEEAIVAAKSAYLLMGFHLNHGVSA